MYNKKYISTFLSNEKENIYLNYLRDSTLLDQLSRQYKQKYTEKADAYYLCLKESLDHYVAMLIHNNPDFLQTREFYNYTQYLKRLVKNNQVKYKGETLYIEPNTNIIFSYLNKEILSKIYPSNTLNEHKEKNNGIKNRLLSKMKKNDTLTREELNLISRILESQKDFDKNGTVFSDSNYDTFIRYVFNNLDNITATPELLQAILTFMPNNYQEKTEDTRVFLANFMKGKKQTSLAFYNSNIDSVFIQFDRFHNIRLNSFLSTEVSRTYLENDIMFLIFVQCHELSHSYQNKQTNNLFNFESASYEINQYLRAIFNDYNSDRKKNFEGNHDSDEIEIDADQRGWKKCHYFIKKYMKDGKQKEIIINNCRKNYEATNCRRAFSFKKDPESKEMLRYLDYDIKKLKEAIKINPEGLKRFAHISKVFDNSGEIKIDYLMEKKIIDTPAGREICNHILNQYPQELLIKKLSAEGVTSNQILTLLENLVHVPHENALVLRELNNVDLETYKEVTSKYRITEQKENVHYYYFAECTHQFVRFTKILDQLQRNRKVSLPAIKSYYDFFRNYYEEMLQNIKKPNIERIDSQLEKFRTSENIYLMNLAVDTINYIRWKNEETSALSDTRSDKNQLNDMLNNLKSQSTASPTTHSRKN